MDKKDAMLVILIIAVLVILALVIWKLDVLFPTPSAGALAQNAVMQ
jgi:flagellar basal body-associated protein FliL